MIRIGQGCDFHRFVAERPLILGGIAIPHSLGLAGHSDADVLLHAVCDAVLGALGKGDIGTWFPPDDPQYKDADSAALLKTVLESESIRSWDLVNLDATLICEAPRLAPYIASMRHNLAALFRASEAQVSVKATTSEGMGFTGRGEGIAALAAVLLEAPCQAENSPERITET